MRDKNDAVPAYAFPVPAPPFSPFEGNYVPAKRISFEFVNCPPNPLLDITGKPLKLSLCFVGEFSVPVHA